MGTFAFLLASLILAAPSPALADPVAVPNPVYRSLESGKTTHDAGVLHGVVQSVDYSSGTIVLKNQRGTQEVTLTPSTAIYEGDQYATLSDLRRGQNVTASVYEVGGRLVAQMIRISK